MADRNCESCGVLIEECTDLKDLVVLRNSDLEHIYYHYSCLESIIKEMDPSINVERFIHSMEAGLI